MAGLKPAFRLNAATIAAYRKAFRDLAAVAGKSDPESLQKLALQSARRFVKNVVDITPPAKGKADAKARQRGEQVILTDLLRLAIPLQKADRTRSGAQETIASAEELLEAHQRAISPGTGRVNPRNRRSLLRVPQAVFNAVAKQLRTRVGWLAAGLNAAAERLGFKLPVWIARHGTKYGQISVKSTASGIRIRVLQNVPYADNVSGLARKWNFALTKEVKALVAQAAVIVKKRARKTGLKLK